MYGEAKRAVHTCLVIQFSSQCAPVSRELLSVERFVSYSAVQMHSGDRSLRYLMIPDCTVAVQHVVMSMSLPNEPPPQD